MRELLDTLDAWRRDGVRVGRAMVIRTYGSAPRPEGAALLYAADGRVAGSVSGGCVEAAAAEEIARSFETGRTRVVRYGVSDEQAWSVGLACGGNIEVLIEPDVPAEAEAAARSAGGVAVVAEPPTDDSADLPPAHRFVIAEAGDAPPGLSADVVAAAREALLRGTSRIVESGSRRFFVEAYPVRPRLVIVGAVETARSLVRLARELGYATAVVDGRAAFATAERFPTPINCLSVGWTRSPTPSPWARTMRWPSSRTIPSWTIRRWSRRSGAAAATWARLARARPSQIGANGCAPRAWVRRTWRASTGPLVSTWAAAPRPR